MEKIVNDINKSFMKILRPFIGGSTTYGNLLNEKGHLLFGDRFLGVFAADQLPKVKDIKVGEMYIANLDDSDESGSHWIGVYRGSRENPKNKKLYVYDSFGRKSSKIIPSLKKTLSKGVKIQDSEYDAEQKESEYSCGLRSMTALYMFDEFDPAIISKYL